MFVGLQSRNLATPERVFQPSALGRNLTNLSVGYSVLQVCNKAVDLAQVEPESKKRLKDSYTMRLLYDGSTPKNKTLLIDELAHVRLLT